MTGEDEADFYRAMPKAYMPADPLVAPVAAILLFPGYYRLCQVAPCGESFALAQNLIASVR